MNTDKMTDIEKQQYIFGNIFLLANKLQVKGDHFLARDDKTDMTLRQWFLTIMILKFKDKHPTLGEVAELMGSSHQNVKQLALKLQEKEFLKIEKDARDGRAIRLKLTQKSRDYWKAREQEGNQFIMDLLQDLSEDEIDVLCKSYSKILDRI
ncbi:transcriptional regulator [Anaerobacillus arseniciselenatis]|uniref:Transcriptional regulator n=1 Tax=Anaerobacillus arseniciselenatis TaxID=85682 RepID=A0A1S2L9M1_9BACI|nr:MarR family transcriptional regulator [Anaerobacillus arseniciselenatis]OIJ08703.1 transcriptional regulator [Anaerobacillus arseniciselenatis]